MKAINLKQINYGDFLTLLAPNLEKRLPLIKEIHKTKYQNNIVFHWAVEDEELTLFKNGIMLFRKGESETVQDARKCSMTYEFLDGSTYEVADEDLNTLPALLVLLEEARTRISDNADRKERYHEEFAVSNDGNDWAEELSVPDFVETAIQEEGELEQERLLEIRKIALQEAMKSLLPSQQEIIRLYYYEKFTQEEIGEKYGISRKAAQERLRWALKKLRKKMAKEVV